MSSCLCGATIKKNYIKILVSSSLCGGIKEIKMKPIKQIKPFLVLTLFAILAVLVMFSPSWAATYCVDVTNGNDSNLGTSQVAPWKTLSKVKASNFQPGDHILFKRGETWRGLLTVPSSGSAGSPIIFGAYGSGNKPIINGAHLFVPGSSWKLHSGNIWKVDLTIKPSQVFFDTTRGSEESGIGGLDAAIELYCY